MAVKNYHSLGHRQKAPAEVFKRRWSDLFTKRSFPLPTRCRPLPALGWLSLSHSTTGVGMTVGPARAPLSLLSVAGGLAACRSPSSAPPSCSLGSALFAAVPLFSPSSSDGGPKSQQRSAADCHTSCSSPVPTAQQGWEKPSPALEVPPVMSRSWAGKAQPAPGPGLAEPLNTPEAAAAAESWDPSARPRASAFNRRLGHRPPPWLGTWGTRSSCHGWEGAPG